ncbi:MAG: AraC family transcriptional regulator [bacterium]|nr:AraC family transcriptional regulator [bacterium]
MHAPIEHIIAAVEYIESRLRDRLDLDAIAFHSTYSRFHFQRLFHACVGFTVFEYIRRRRLSEAARALAHPKAPDERRIIDVALDLGFGSHAGFTRGFRECFGVSPDEYRRRGGGPLYGIVEACTREQLAHLQRLQTNAGDEPEYAVRALNEIQLACGPGVGPHQAEILKAWGGFLRNHGRTGFAARKFAGLIEYAPVQNDAIAFQYSPAILLNESESEISDAATLRTRTIPAGDYLICIHRGAVADLKRTFFYIYGPLLTKVKRNLRPSFECDLEVYADSTADGPGFRSPDDPDNRIEIRVPLL